MHYVTQMMRIILVLKPAEFEFHSQKFRFGFFFKTKLILKIEKW